MSIVERIKQKAKEQGINISALEKSSGLGNGVIRRWDERSPQCDKIAPVANCLKVSLDWLVLGKENSDLSEIEQKLLSSYRAASPDIQGATRRLLNVPEPEPESEIETSSEYKIG